MKEPDIESDSSMKNAFEKLQKFPENLAGTRLRLLYYQINNSTAVGRGGQGAWGVGEWMKARGKKGAVRLGKFSCFSNWL